MRLTLEGDVTPLPPGVDLTAYRIVQEALTNARRHAPGASVAVTLGYEEDALRLRVSDDGPGPPAADTSGHGLLGMQERATMVGGRLKTGPGDDGGFVVEAEPPSRGPRHDGPGGRGRRPGDRAGRVRGAARDPGRLRRRRHRGRRRRGGGAVPGRAPGRRPHGRAHARASTGSRRPGSWRPTATSARESSCSRPSIWTSTSTTPSVRARAASCSRTSPPRRCSTRCGWSRREMPCSPRP